MIDYSASSGRPSQLGSSIDARVEGIVVALSGLVEVDDMPDRLEVLERLV